MRTVILVLALSGVLLGACGVADLRERFEDGASPDAYAPENPTVGPTPTPFPCWSRMRPGGEGAAYVPGEGGVRGCVTDTAGRAVSGVGVVVESQPPGVALPAVGIETDGSGRYWDGMLQAPGAYVLAVYAEGYEVARERVEIREGRTAVLDFVLEPLSPAKATASAIAEARATPILPPTPYPFPCQSEIEGLVVEGSAGEYIGGIGLGYGVIGCIRDERGEGIAGATTVARPLDAGLPRGYRRYQTGEDGRYYEVNVAGLGWWEITARAPGYESATKLVRTRNQMTSVVDFTLRRER